MTDRTCLDVAAHAIANRPQSSDYDPFYEARRALDAIHPALAHLTPDDVAALFAYASDRHRKFQYSDEPVVPVHAWEVLSRKRDALAARIEVRELSEDVKRVDLYAENRALRVRAETAEAKLAHVRYLIGGSGSAVSRIVAVGIYLDDTAAHAAAVKADRDIH